MSDTLGTLKKASELIIQSGAKSVRAIATHGVLSGKAMENLESSKLVELMVSDSIPSVYEKERNQNVDGKLKVISCDKIIAKSIWSISQRKSIHEINVV
jgi:ribose-phosphate pyrophosphokinase